MSSLPEEERDGHAQLSIRSPRGSVTAGFRTPGQRLGTDNGSIPLCAATMERVGAVLPVPAYDRSRLAAGVVHVGVGGFHRAHQAMFHDRLMSDEGALEWGICGVGARPEDAGMKEAMDAQDCLYTLVEKDSDGGADARVIGSIARYVYAPDERETAIEAMADPDVRIISLTITEGGYNVDPDTHEFDADDPDVARDLDHPEEPTTVFGLVVEALRRRRERDLDPVTVMSCDNLPGNGVQARAAFTSFARLRDPALGEWVESCVAFPNSMVDRITPATTDEDRAEVSARFGVDDRWPVLCEPFVQWVLEDSFAAGRPPYERVGVQLVDDVEPYELMKLRLLNAGHQLLAYFGQLCGYHFVHEAAQDPSLRALLLGYLTEEAAPTLPEVPGVDLGDYNDSLLERFSNPHVPDTLARLAAYGSDRIPKFMVPVIRAQLNSTGKVQRSAAVVASWARYAEGVDEQGEPIEIVDNRADALTEAARRGREHPEAFIEQRDLFGDLADDPRFVGPFREALESLRERGAKATLQALVEPGHAPEAQDAS
jgi:mannitol 2-dehydrogenase